jgi:guanyl-specific ribonuclease Sa
MRRHLRNPWVWAAAIVLLVAWLLWPRTVQSPAPAEVPPAATAPAGGMASLDTSLEPTRTSALPPEAYRTLALIARGGPFPYHQDGQVFANREGLLPPKPLAYYREYTVDTPGAGNRGARRIVVGGHPPEAWYYTDDHYASFTPFDGRVATAGGQ